MPFQSTDSAIAQPQIAVLLSRHGCVNRQIRDLHRSFMVEDFYGVTYIAADTETLLLTKVMPFTPIKLADAKLEDYDALLLPNCAYRFPAKRLRQFVREWDLSNRPMVAIGRSLGLLARLRLLEGRHVTAGNSLTRRLVRKFGGLLVERELVEDGALLTAQRSEYLVPFLLDTLRGMTPKQPHWARHPLPLAA